MERTDYGGGAGYAPCQDPATIMDGAQLSAAQDARRDLLIRLPPGRALDAEDLASMLDEGNQTSRAIALRKRVLKEWRREVPAGVLIMPTELEKVRAWSEAHPTRPGAVAGIPEWPASR